MLSRLGGKAFTHTYARSDEEALNPYLSAQNVFVHLAQVFKDKDKHDNHRRAYKALQQGTMSFQDFFAEVVRLSAFLRYDEAHMLPDLKEKINPRLRGQLLGSNSLRRASMSQVQDFLVSADNAYRADRLKEELAEKEERFSLLAVGIIPGCTRFWN